MMKALNVKFNIFKGLIAILMISCFAANSKAGTISTTTLQADTSKKLQGIMSKINMNKKPINAFAIWQVKKDQLGLVLNLASELASKCRAEKGNLFYKVHQSTSDVNTLIYFEGYKDETAVEEHRNSEHYKTLIKGKILPLLEDRKVVLATQLYQN